MCRFIKTFEGQAPEPDRDSERVQVLHSLSTGYTLYAAEAQLQRAICDAQGTGQYSST